jgi:molybdopterin synthase catalytic subunit/molybdopterin converting factor small subunit
MDITVRFFAVQRAQTGRRTLDLTLADGASVDAAWATLVTQMPELEPATSSVRFARNGVYVDGEAALADGDELAVIPPVAGGADGASGPSGSTTSHRRVELHDEPFPGDLLDRLRNELATPADGAVAMFVGQTRESPGTPAPGQEAEAERFEGQHVSGLTYEAFEPMALSVLETIADEIEARFGVTRLAILHRTGEVAVGATSVIIVVASPHRAEAFEASRYAIEELKARAPIWKAERFADGSVWMGAPARTGPEEER